MAHLIKPDMTSLIMTEPLSNDNFKILCQSLSTNTVLTKLGIITNYMSKPREIPNIRELHISGCTPFDMLTVVFLCNDDLRSLHIKGDIDTIYYNRRVFYDYLKTANLRELTIRGTCFRQEPLFESIYKNTSLTHLDILGNVTSSALKNIKLPNLLEKTNIVSLGISSHTLDEICQRYPNCIVNNTTLNNLTLYAYQSIPDELFHNLSVISCKYCFSERDVEIDSCFGKWVNINKSFRWNMQHPMIINTYLALSSKNSILPPYVFLEIYDRMINSDTGILGYNPFVSHRQKIQLMQSLYNSMRFNIDT